MAFVYCRKCDYQQEFWSEGWTPITGSSMKSDQEDLLASLKDKEKRVRHYDQNFVEESGVPQVEGAKAGTVRLQDAIAWDLKRRASWLEKQKWFTEQDFKDDPDPTCPECGGKEFGID